MTTTLGLLLVAIALALVWFFVVACASLLDNTDDEQ
jgi:hypothetical protein